MHPEHERRTVAGALTTPSDYARGRLMPSAFMRNARVVRASSIAVGAPAHRAPTTMTSNIGITGQSSLLVGIALPRRSHPGCFFS
jgi:hypothetical protein